MYTLQRMFESKIVAVVRGAKYENIVPIAKALNSGGVKNLEITAETPNVLSLIEKASSEMGDEMTIGAGTVLDPETARAAIMAGAQFIFSPTINNETIRMAKRYGAVSIPGAMTPTEILTAYEQGADIVKLFPAGVMGPGYLRDIQGPLSHIPLMPTGGVNLENITDYINAGAVAIGLGGALINTKYEVNSRHLEQITEKAKQFTRKINNLE